MLNIGGIANVTVLPADAELEAVSAFDLGPGNMLLDGAVSFLTGGSERFDRDGRRALGRHRRRSVGGAAHEARIRTEAAAQVDWS